MTPEVYPRPRGEATARRRCCRCPSGLSPPTRGSLVVADLVLEPEGSIPAHAGKPGPGIRSPVPTGVYPRPRGEAADELALALRADGLSPPTRGSRAAAGAHPPADGSIPAHAGKPSMPPPAPGPASVYPRPRGEAMMMSLRAPPPFGLSPPTRGSLVEGGMSSIPIGSIPAHAGKPERRGGRG